MTADAIATTKARPRRTVGIVVNTFNQARFLKSSLESCIRQTRPADAILVLDDGSTDDPSQIVALFPGITCLRQANAGLAAARNAGLRALECDYIIFLDADDLLRPQAVEAALECFSAHEDAWMVYGAHRLIDASGMRTSPVWHRELGPNALETLLACNNIIAMHATVAYARRRLIEVGGFDESLRTCEDYDLYLRIAQRGKISSHEKLVAEYRHHGQNMSGDYRMMLKTALSVLDRWETSDQPLAIREAAAIGRGEMMRHYGPEIVVDRGKQILRRSPTFEDIRIMAKFGLAAPWALIRSAPARALRGLVQRLPARIGRQIDERFWAPRRGAVDFGDFARTQPIGEVFGFNRGTPVDRYYVAKYLTLHKQQVRGRVLEVGDNTYTAAVGGTAVDVSDILHIHAGNPKATFVGDLADPTVLPKDTFDCIVLTQTLHLVYDMRQAVANLHAALAPGGALLITVPGISPIEPWEWRDSWYWSLTVPALQRLLEEQFEPAEVDCRAYGNVFAAICFLAGLCAEELDPGKLDIMDRNFPVTVAACAIKRHKQ